MVLYYENTTFVVDFHKKKLLFNVTGDNFDYTVIERCMP